MARVYDSEKRKERTLYRKEHHLCVACGGECESGSTCRRCRFKYSEYREKKKAMGLCVACSEPALPGHTYCEKHLKELNERTKKWNAIYQQRRANEL